MAASTIKVSACAEHVASLADKAVADAIADHAEAVDDAAHVENAYDSVYNPAERFIGYFRSNDALVNAHYNGLVLPEIVHRDQAANRITRLRTIAGLARAQAEEVKSSPQSAAPCVPTAEGDAAALHTIEGTSIERAAHDLDLARQEAVAGYPLIWLNDL